MIKYNFPKIAGAMKRTGIMITAAASVVLLLAYTVGCPRDGKTHLFILSGQSNMRNLDPKVSFEPVIKHAFRNDNIVVVKDATGGQPIQRWYRQWKTASGDRPDVTGDLYDRLMTNVAAAIEGNRPNTITLVWMQGEADAKRKLFGEVYSASLKGLIDQLRRDMNREDVNVVIGRISDFDMNNYKFYYWTKVREAQVEVAEADARCEWIDTDDLNGPSDCLHYTEDGYRTMGKRLAEASIRLIKVNDANSGWFKKWFSRKHD